jgi:DNA polymerase II
LSTAKVFLLTGEWYDSHGKNQLVFYGVSEELGTVEIIFSRIKPVFFVEHEAELLGIESGFLRKEVKLRTFNNKKVDAVYFNTQRKLKTVLQELDSHDIKTYESDVDPVRRFLMERFINVQMEIEGECTRKDKFTSFANPKVKPCEVIPGFKIMSIDIETGLKNSVLYSIAVHVISKELEEKKVFMLSGSHSKNLPDYISVYSDEQELLKGFIDWFGEADPDIIIGWHVIGFDLMFLERRCNELHIPFLLARGNGRISLRSRKNGGYFASISGRIVIDGPPSLRAGFFTFEDYKLETVAQELLGTGKTITPEQDKLKEIEKLFKEDKAKLAEYNLQDAVLVTDIFKKTGLIELSIRRAQLSGLLMDQLGMMTAAFDHFFLPKLHRFGYVAPNVKDIVGVDHAAGGYVIDPKPGIYSDVAVLDFKSLYPSIIRTFKIDPLSRLLSETDQLITPTGYKFSSTKHFLPEFIEYLMTQRSEAKKKKDKQLSQAIKILMNSFYGVMGAYNCRFYHPDLPSAITRTGQYLLLGSRDYFESKGYEVVYGDTDSLFVKLKSGESKDKETVGNNLAEELNGFWKEKLMKDYSLISFLEIEYEKYYKKFIITPARGSETGAKKRYAGLLLKDGKEKLEFVGMEYVRSDWTRLAKEFQVELYQRIFQNREVTGWIRKIVTSVKNGEFDDKLIYHKRLRKNIDEYTKNIPPQVRAARMIDTTAGTVYYVITKRGPIPIELEHNDIDYQHYIDKQLKPVADSVLVLLGESFDAIVQSGQLNFFDELD